MSDPLDEAFESFSTSVVRLETLPRYSEEEDEEGLRRFLAGDPSVGRESTEWSRYVGELVGSGKTVRRVRVVTAPLTDYVRYQLHAGYQPGLRAGEDIRVWVDADGDVERSDVWLFDESVLIRMHYDEAGNYVDSTMVSNPTDIETARALISKLWTRSTPLLEFRVA